MAERPPVVPVVLDALVHILTAAPSVPVKVFDGPETQWPERVDLIAVGLSPENLANPARRDPAGFSATAESADITCLARSWAAGSTVKPRRDRAYQLLSAVIDVIAADRTLGGACSHAEVTGSIYLPFQTPKGLLVDVVFTVRATAF